MGIHCHYLDVYMLITATGELYCIIVFCLYHSFIILDMLNLIHFIFKMYLASY